ncbi:MAG: signal peptidase I [Chloroflexi bacterium]|nr:signal peptidase I [Chloroflexota bacterium]
MRAFFRDTLTVIVIAAIIVAGQRAIAPKIVVDGPSMNVNLHNGQQIIVNRLVYKFHKPERGDVIVFYPPMNGKEEYIKRIIGLPGESVEIKAGVVYIHKKDGTVFPLSEAYIAEPARQSFRGGTIPENEYFVLGDNRNNSSDSRSGWTVPFQNIVGKAWLSVWPPSDWGTVTNYLAQEQQTALSIVNTNLIEEPAPGRF